MIAPNPPAVAASPAAAPNPAPIALKPVPCSRCGCPHVWGDAKGNWWCTSCNPPANQRQVRRKLELMAEAVPGVADAEPAGRWLEHHVEIPPPPSDPYGPPAGVDVNEWFDSLPSPMTADMYRRAERLCLGGGSAVGDGPAVVAKTAPNPPAPKVVAAATAAASPAKVPATPPAVVRKRALRKVVPVGTRAMFGVDGRDGVGV